MAIVPTDHPLARRQSVRFDELVDLEFISLEKGSSIDTLCVKSAAELGKQLKLRVRVSGFDALFRLVQAHMGVGIVPLEITGSRAGLGDLCAIPLDEPWAPRTLVLAVRNRASLPPATRLMVDHLLKG